MYAFKKNFVIKYTRLVWPKIEYEHNCLLKRQRNGEYTQSKKCSQQLTSISFARRTLLSLLEILLLFYEETHNHNAPEKAARILFSHSFSFSLTRTKKASHSLLPKDNFLKCDYKARDKALPISTTIQLVSSFALSREMGRENFLTFFFLSFYCKSF